jgi:hypothetical protein
VKNIFKYELTGTAIDIKMPDHSEILSVGLQGDKIMVWALVNNALPLVTKSFQVFGTGWDISNLVAEKLKFIGTVQMSDGLVFHVFERF